MCETRLEQIADDMDDDIADDINNVKQAIDKNTKRIEQAEADRGLLQMFLIM